ncbi:hypothetical protein SDC9_208607 [bioreactor metagenome]|uniref:Uncharacterized protein n=1 Tax=bioreactor metagenome TaxID=1076179 RepID=A0A645JKM2_9ZZZZ
MRDHAVGHATRAHRHAVVARGEALRDEHHHRRYHQQQPDDRAHAEILLPDHLFIDVGGQHAVIAADHLRRAEV